MAYISGLAVNTQQLATVAPRGLAAAITGSVLPVSIAFFVARVIYGYAIKQSLAAALSLSATSAGISLNILKSAKVLETTTGQIVIAAAVMDNVIALILLAELDALHLSDTTAADYIIPIASSLAFLFILGSFLVLVWPSKVDM
eukprot:8213850-Pyramimonas_sp.AAC.2